MAKKVSKRQVQIQVDVKTAQALGALKRLGKMNHKVFNRMAKDLDQMNSPWARFKNNIIAINQGLDLLRRVSRATFGQLLRMTNEAREQDKVLSDLAATLNRAGIGWDENSDRVMEFAATLQRTAGIADNETQRTMQLITAMGRGVLTSFEDVQNATEFVLNFSAQTGQGLETLARIMARVASGEVAALSRSSAGLASQLEVMKEAGATGSEMLAFLAEQMRGVAAEFDPASIKIGRLAASYGDVREAIGGIVLEAIRASPVLDDIATSFDELGEAIKDPTTEAGRFARVAIGSVIGAATFGAQTLGRFALAFQMFSDGMEVARGAAELAVFEFEKMLIRLERMDQERRRRRLPEAQRENLELVERLRERQALIEDLSSREGLAGTGPLPDMALIRVAAGTHRSVIRLDRDMEAAHGRAMALRNMHNEVIDAIALTTFHTGALASEMDGSAGALARVDDELARVTEGQGRARDALAASQRAFSDNAITMDDGIRLLGEWGAAMDEALQGAGALDLTGGDVGDVAPAIDESGGTSGRGWAGAFLQGIQDGLVDFREETGDVISRMLSDWREYISLSKVKNSGAEVGEEMGAGIAQGLGTATQAIQAMTSTIPTMMGDAATSGIQKFGATMQLLQKASTLAAEAGGAAAAASSWLGPLSMFFGLASATAAFASAIGGAGSAGGDPASPAQEAAGADVADVLVGQRPEAARGGQARVIQMSIGSILSTDDSRNQVRDWIVEMGTLGELQGVRVGG